LLDSYVDDIQLAQRALGTRIFQSNQCSLPQTDEWAVFIFARSWRGSICVEIYLWKEKGVYRENERFMK